MLEVTQIPCDTHSPVSKEIFYSEQSTTYLHNWQVRYIDTSYDTQWIKLFRLFYWAKIRSILEEACSQEYPESAICVRRFDDSLNSAIRTTYRISLRSSSLPEPRYPLLRVVQHSVKNESKIESFLEIFQVR